MRHEEETSRTPPEPRSLEERLRDLPPPAVPPGLRDRILSAAPRFQPRAGRAPWKWPLAGLAAAVALLAFLLRFDPSSLWVVRKPATAPSSPDALYSAASDPKETDPCNVLPPLPHWRS